MTSPQKVRQTVWVMHSGALGDWVLVWPLLRALGRADAQVVAVTHESKARLAAEWIDCAPGAIVPLRGGIEQARLTRWWSGPDSCHSLGTPSIRDSPLLVPSPDRIITFLCDDSAPAGRAWLAAAAAEFPHAAIEAAGAHGFPSRTELWARADVATRGGIPPRINPSGPIVCHVGAGSIDKRWPLDRWAALIGTLRAQRRTVEVLAGEVEQERFNDAERACFGALGGRFVGELERLAIAIAAARLFIGADTGPTHLAAQLGIPTLALFGPTDPGIWAPIGPAVRVLAPPLPRPMEWLEVERALPNVRAMIEGARTLWPE